MKPNNINVYVRPYMYVFQYFNEKKKNHAHFDATNF